MTTIVERPEIDNGPLLEVMRIVSDNIKYNNYSNEKYHSKKIDELYDVFIEAGRLINETEKIKRVTNFKLIDNP